MTPLLDGPGQDPDTLLRALPPIEAGELVPPGARAVLVAPHPDDEVLGAGGLLQQLAALDRELLLVAATDGEGSHPGSRRLEPPHLARVRIEETGRSLARLGLEHVPQRRLGLPDRGLHRCQRALEEALAPLLLRRDVLLTTWRRDGHGDHRAVGEAAARLCGGGRRLIELPVWASGEALARGPERRRARRVVLTAAERSAKRRAIAEHRTQLETDPDVPGGPVLDPGALDALLRSDEVVLT